VYRRDDNLCPASIILCRSSCLGPSPIRSIYLYDQADRGVYVAKVKPPRGSQSSSSLEGRDENRPADLHVVAILGETSTRRIIYYWQIRAYYIMLCVRMFISHCYSIIRLTRCHGWHIIVIIDLSTGSRNNKTKKANLKYILLYYVIGGWMRWGMSIRGLCRQYLSSSLSLRLSKTCLSCSIVYL